MSIKKNVVEVGKTNKKNVRSANMSNEWKGNKICRRRRIMEFVHVHQENARKKTRKDAEEKTQRKGL